MKNDDAKAKRREYYASNKEKMRATARKSYYRHREKKLEKRKAYYRANRDKCRAWWREYRNRPEIKERRHAAALARYARDGAQMRAYERGRYRKMCELLAIDAKAYYDFRAKRRVKWVMQLEKPENYKPRFSIRIPDWATKGQRVLDARSQWLACNLTDAQRAYARKLFIERRERMCR